jgi:hypothetical protein
MVALMATSFVREWRTELAKAENEWNMGLTTEKMEPKDME